ncbi:hypothetical protein AAFF_G00042140 [Aldrovandia affinis]|uniref:Uncharacterized protein n=1 Tax=Aldrovandia affinis TaxID=143900 RepID=A0AAD7WG89_9TELE|nr:hypothetical protein AAFF_G00042140 [Aldrovandia affinis]
MAFYAQSCSIFCFVSIQTILIFSVSSPGTESLSFPQHYTMIHWAGRIEKEIEKVLQHVSGAQQMRGPRVSRLRNIYAAARPQSRENTWIGVLGSVAPPLCLTAAFCSVSTVVLLPPPPAICPTCLSSTSTCELELERSQIRRPFMRHRAPLPSVSLFKRSRASMPGKRGPVSLFSFQKRTPTEGSNILL